MLKCIGKFMILASLLLVGINYNKNSSHLIEIKEGFKHNFNIDLNKLDAQYKNCLFNFFDFLGYFLILSPLILLDRKFNFTKLFSFMSLLILTITVKINFSNYLENTDLLKYILFSLSSLIV